MKIAVCTSVVPDTYSKIKISPDGYALDLESTEQIINPLDELCLQRALPLKEAGQAHRVDMVCVGLPYMDNALRKGLALGADKAFRIDFPAQDSYSVAGHLACFLSGKGYDLIFCSDFSWDFAGGMTGCYLAESLALPLVASCMQLDLQGGTVHFKRETCDGFEEGTVGMPVILSGKKGIISERDLRIPAFKAMMAASRTSIETVAEKEGFEPSNRCTHGIRPLLRFDHFMAAPARGKVTMFSVDELDKVVELIREACACGEGSVQEQKQVKEIFAGRILAHYSGDDSAVRAQAMESVIRLNGQKINITKTEVVSGAAQMDRARIVISGGMGVAIPQGWALLEQFAQSTGAALACTKAVYDRGMRPYHEHVGQTGHKVSPTLYIACGISGALQHMAGVTRAGKILAINTDAQAPVFSMADYGIVGDVFEILPKIIAKLD